jgi:non-ribosomal peptide synthetase-like protein
MMFGYWTYVTLLPLCAIYVVSFIVLTALCVRILGPGRRSSGSHSLYSTAFVQQWFADAVMTASLVCIKPIYATIFTPHYLRLLGARVGNRAEVSTVKHISAFNLTVGAETFLADSVSVGSARVQRGQITIKPTVIGNGTFIGNSALLPGGTTLGAGILIGALSTTPHQAVQHESTTSVAYPADGTSWVGSPSFELPNRPVSTAFPKSLTFDPPFRLVLARAFMECFKITLPPYFSFLAVSLMFEVYKIGKEKNCMFLAKVVLCSSTFFFCLLGLSVVTVALKWLIIGRYRPSQHPLWSSFVWRSELVNGLCEAFVYPFFVSLWLGTPWATSFFRLMGSECGNDIYLDTSEITEFDLVHIGDRASLSTLATVQTHLFEDRVMKMSHLKIGEGASVGAYSVVLYDSEIEAGGRVLSLSLLMKGEVVPAGTTWQGIPCGFVSSV